MFQLFRHIDVAFKLVKGFCAMVIILCLLVCAYAIYKTSQTVRENSEVMYILADGKVLEAHAGSRRDNIPVEARDHIKTFHQFFFTLDPDDKAIQSGITKALYLADGSAKKAYDNLQENGYYASLISGNISQTISIDSVKVNISAYPFYWRCYATEQITRATSIVIRNLITEGYLREVSRSDNNPHGFLIERWNTIENKDIKTDLR
ncbi:MAG: conjugative transposon protein TraK [Bacteroidota bacterium]|nr:conjugative transposon protein TraK [Bacteroidota bacterium]